MAIPFGLGKLSEKDYTFAGFKGLRNTVDITQFEMEDLEVAMNVDLNDAGVPRMRQGFAEPFEAGAYHSIGPSGYPRCFAVTGTVLKEILPDLSLVSLVTGLTAGRSASYLPLKDRYYWTNGVQKGVIEPSGARTWGIVPPPPIAASVTDGSLMLGKEDLSTARYQFSMTYLRSDNQESGAPRARYLDVPTSGGLAFSDLPVSADPGVDRKCIYVSEANGEKLWRAAVIPNADTTFEYRHRTQMALPLATMFLRPPPAGALMALHGGSLLVALGNRLYYSEPYAYELFDWRKAKVFPSVIQILCVFDDGVCIGTEDQHVWLTGSTPENYEWKTIANYGAIPGTLDIDADASMFGKDDKLGETAVWASKEGLVRGANGGRLENLTRDRFLYPVQARGTGLFRTQRGMNQYMVVLRGDQTAADSFLAQPPVEDNTVFAEATFEMLPRSYVIQMAEARAAFQLPIFTLSAEGAA